MARLSGRNQQAAQGKAQFDPGPRSSTFGRTWVPFKNKAPAVKSSALGKASRPISPIYLGEFLVDGFLDWETTEIYLEKDRNGF